MASFTMAHAMGHRLSSPVQAARLFALSPLSKTAQHCSEPRRQILMKASGKFLIGGNWKCNGAHFRSRQRALEDFSATQLVRYSAPRTGLTGRNASLLVVSQARSLLGGKTSLRARCCSSFEVQGSK